MIRQGLEFWVNKDIRRRAFELTVFSHASPDTVAVAKTLVFETIEPNETIARPSMSLTFEEAEALITELWNSGVRPSGVGSSGELAATKAHLEDMRTLVFKEMRL
jgi:hypothetical protein